MTGKQRYKTSYCEDRNFFKRIPVMQIFFSIWSCSHLNIWRRICSCCARNMTIIATNVILRFLIAFICETALEYFQMTSEIFNGYFQKKAKQNGNYRNLIQDHEGRLSSIFDIMLYGIAKEPILNDTPKEVEEK